VPRRFTARISSALRGSSEKTEAAWSTASQSLSARSTCVGIGYVAGCDLDIADAERRERGRDALRGPREHADPVSGRGQSRDRVGADVSRSTCDQYTHGSRRLDGRLFEPLRPEGGADVDVYLP
jgi:hypothetical protein